MPAHSTRRAALVLTLGLALAGCGHPHPAPDAQLVADLQAAIVATTQAMGRPLAAQDAVAQAQQLAWASDPVRVRAIRAGALGTPQVVDEARALARRVRATAPGASPPEVLTWLSAPGRALDARQAELLDAVRAQTELELKAPAR